MLSENDVNVFELGSYLDEDAPVESVRYIGPMSKVHLNAVGVLTVGDLKRVGVIDAYLAVKQKGYRVNINFVWAMFAGLMGVDFHQVPLEFKAAVRKQIQNAQA